MPPISVAVFDTLECLKPEDVGGDEPKLKFSVDSDRWDATTGRAIDQVNEQLIGVFRVQGFAVTPQVPNRGAVVVWKPPRSRLPVKSGQTLEIRWLFPFVDTIHVKLIERDGGLLDTNDNLGTKKVTNASNGAGMKKLMWKGGSGLTASRFHYKLSYFTSLVPEPLLRDALDPTRLPSLSGHVQDLARGLGVRSLVR